MNKYSFRFASSFLVLVMVLILFAVLGGSAGAADDVWLAEFWNNKDLSGQPVLVRYDQTIDFDWGHGSPAKGVDDDNFSARWTRKVYFPAGNYRFNATMDDAMRVWIDGNLIIDSWTDSQEHTMTRDLFMSQGDHDIRVDYYEAGGVAVAKFWWDFLGSSGGSGGGFGGGSGGSGGSGGGFGGGGYFPNWRGEYFNNTTLSGAPVLVRDDRYLQFDWGFGSPQPGVVNDDFFSARWTRTLTANPGQYRIWLTSDDGSRLYINNQLLIDNWGVQAPTTRAVDYFHPGGSVQIRVEYFENLERATITTGVALVTGYQESLTNKPGQ
jgi:hypothetical protein